MSYKYHQGCTPAHVKSENSNYTALADHGLTGSKKKSDEADDEKLKKDFKKE